MLSTNRCPWSNGPDIYKDYHDQEWGVPVHDDRLLFEMLILEGAQAGLSWLTILRKRQSYREAFANFSIDAIARYSDNDVLRLMQDSGIVRNRLKIAATIRNAQRCQLLFPEPGSLDRYLWQFVGGRPVQNHRGSMAEVPARTPESDAMSRDLLANGFKFVGSTICYAFMQAVGMVNDHLVTCPRHPEVALLSGSPVPR
jgi:DNA-3-methyladenine glycosylase I